MFHRTAVCIALCLVPATTFADTFTFIDENKNERSEEARLAGTTRGWLALEFDDGHIELIRETAVKTRTPGPDPKPVTPQVMADRLEERFTKELFRYDIEKNYVIGFVLAAPLENAAAARLKGFFAKAGRFMNTVERNFTNFADKMKLDTQPVRYPLVLLVFETDKVFEKYVKDTTAANEGLSANRIAGFYSGLSNLLAIRMDECDSFEVPLHEAIHQQVFNRGVFQRLAPLPVWFNEGIATGFENDGDRIGTNPAKVNRRYALQSQKVSQLTFANVIETDDGFRGDVLAGEAYTLAWCLHWLLVTERPKEYAEFVKTLGTIKPLATVSKDSRISDFREAFNLEPEELGKMYSQRIVAGLRKQRIRLVDNTPVGKLVMQDNTGKVEVGVVHRLDRGGVLTSTGKLKNISPIRELIFRVSVISTNGQPIFRWTKEVGPNKIVSLPTQTAPYPGAAGFRVEVLSALKDSEEAKSWGRIR